LEAVLPARQITRPAANTKKTSREIGAANAPDEACARETAPAVDSNLGSSGSVTARIV
jgi:hypothetical protein